jgi:hypothetical protein
MLRDRALLVGSVNLPGPEQVFRAVATHAADVLSRIPDGETDARSDWIVAQVPVLDRQQQLEPGETFVNPQRTHPRWRIREGVRPEEIQLGSLGYADTAVESYRVFTRLKQEGVIPTDMRFQVSLPTPNGVVGVFIEPAHAQRFEPVYERHLLDEVARIAQVVPSAELAVQWDVAIEMIALQGVWETYVEGDLVAGFAERIARVVDAIPAGVEAGVHLCYGDSGGKHFAEPTDTKDLTALSNAIFARARRPIDWLHLPVPIERDDEAYCASLSGLALPDETTLYLGLLHKEDGIEGARRRIAAARAAVADFGVATECGMARDATPEDIPGLLALHAEVGRELEGVAV